MIILQLWGYRHHDGREGAKIQKYKKVVGRERKAIK
jgi:hypothetical protein